MSWMDVTFPILKGKSGMYPSPIYLDVKIHHTVIPYCDSDGAGQDKK